MKTVKPVSEEMSTRKKATLSQRCAQIKAAAKEAKEAIYRAAKEAKEALYREAEVVEAYNAAVALYREAEAALYRAAEEVDYKAAEAEAEAYNVAAAICEFNEFARFWSEDHD